MPRHPLKEGNWYTQQLQKLNNEVLIHDLDQINCTNILELMKDSARQRIQQDNKQNQKAKL